MKTSIRIVLTVLMLSFVYKETGVFTVIVLALVAIESEITAIFMRVTNENLGEVTNILTRLRFKEIIAGK